MGEGEQRIRAPNEKCISLLLLLYISSSRLLREREIWLRPLLLILPSSRLHSGSISKNKDFSREEKTAFLSFYTIGWLGPHKPQFQSLVAWRWYYIVSSPLASCYHSCYHLLSLTFCLHLSVYRCQSNVIFERNKNEWKNSLEYWNSRSLISFWSSKIL